MVVKQFIPIITYGAICCMLNMFLRDKNIPVANKIGGSMRIKFPDNSIITASHLILYFKISILRDIRSIIDSNTDKIPDETPRIIVQYKEFKRPVLLINE